MENSYKPCSDCCESSRHCQKQRENEVEKNCVEQEMGTWRALMGRARGRPRYPSSSSASTYATLSFSSSSLAEAEQHQLRPTPRFITTSLESHDACVPLNEPIWLSVGLRLSPLIHVQKNTRQNEESMFKDAKDFLLDSNSNEGLGRLNFRSAGGSLQTVEQKEAWLIARASSQAEFGVGTLSSTKPWLKAGACLENSKALLMGFLKHNATEHSEGFSWRFSTRDFLIRTPGFYGSEAVVIQADSVKRKRKKKMNKHKHRKLRRLARKSRK